MLRIKLWIAHAEVQNGSPERVGHLFLSALCSQPSTSRRDQQCQTSAARSLACRLMKVDMRHFWLLIFGISDQAMGMLPGRQQKQGQAPASGITVRRSFVPGVGRAHGCFQDTPGPLR